MSDRRLSLPSGSFRLKNANVPLVMLNTNTELGANCSGSIAVDLDVDERGNITQICRAGGDHQEAHGLATIDLAGRQLWAGLIDAHTHLDKAFTWARAPNPNGTLNGARKAAKRDRSRQWSQADVTARMEFAIRTAIAHGTAGLRTHIDSQAGRIFPSWPAFRALQHKWSAHIELQAVATLGASKLVGSYGDELCGIAKSHGAKALGPVVYRSGNLEQELLRSFELAERYNCSPSAFMRQIEVVG